MALFNGKRRRADMLPSCFCISGSVGRNARFSFDICAETVQMSHEAERVDFIKDGYLSASVFYILQIICKFHYLLCGGNQFFL